MLITINPGSEAPLYRQIVDQVRSAIRDGQLKPGDRLPSLRDLSRDLVINHLTVKRAYDSLEAAELIGSARGQGTFVRPEAAVRARAGSLDDLKDEMAALLARLRQQGGSKVEAHGLVDETWGAADL